MAEESSSVDIIKHQLVPRHEIMAAEDKKELLERIGAVEKNLPKMLDSDPVAAKIGAKPGDVIKITRKSQTAGESVYYRIVAEK